MNSDDVLRRIESLLRETTDPAPPDLSAEEVQALLAELDRRVAAAERTGETEGHGRPPGPEIFVDRMTAEEVVARLHELEEQEQAELRQARADRAAYSRREQDDEGKDEGGGLLAGLRDNNDGRMGR